MVCKKEEKALLVTHHDAFISSLVDKLALACIKQNRTSRL
jgi:hypothetical protein